MKIEVVDCQDHDDGGATLTLDLDDEAMRHFASIGLLKVIKDTVKNVLSADEDV